MNKIQSIGAQIAADPKNHATEHPLFVVFEWERIYGANDAEDHEWRSEDWTDAADRETARSLDEQYAETGEEPAGWHRCLYTERRRFITACLTRDGAERFIAANSHRYNGAHVYVESLYRNEEMIAIRQHLMDAAREVKP